MQWVKREPTKGEDCNKFQAHNTRPSLTSNDLGQQTSKMNELVKQILQQNSPKTTQRDRLSLIKGLSHIPREKRKEVLVHISKNLHHLSHQNGGSFLNNEQYQLNQQSTNELGGAGRKTGSSFNKQNSEAPIPQT